MPTASRQLRAARAREGVYGTEPPKLGSIELLPEWNAVCHDHCNVLVEAPPAVAEQIISALRPHLRYPILEYSFKAGVPMQPPAEGSVILLEVASLLPEQQAQLLRWLDEGAGRFDVQLASTSSEPLFPLVERGAFDATLYYRLNTIRIEWFDSTDG
jgi:hypothetical protein